jgi:anaerobic selenocysteine-containing dehydrogenase
MKTPRKAGKGYSRRQFLKGIPLGAVAAVAVGAISGRLIASALGRRRKPPVFPEGSIFTPADDEQRRA